jgi:hypothetical protein
MKELFEDISSRLQSGDIFKIDIYSTVCNGRATLGSESTMGQLTMSKEHTLISIPSLVTNFLGESFSGINDLYK